MLLYRADGLLSRHPPPVTRHPFRVGGRDEAQFAIENAE
jgi:hypothetical protein